MVMPAAVVWFLIALDTPEDPPAHEITPAEGSARRGLAPGMAADLRNPLHYPVIAACRECGREIFCASALLGEWWHSDDDGAGDGQTGA